MKQNHNVLNNIIPQEEMEYKDNCNKDKWQVILLFGPPGSGKGTIGRNLSLVTGHLHISTGDIFRGISPSTYFGERCAFYSQQGLLIPDELTFEIWSKYVYGLIATNNFYPESQILLLDGIPRTKQQVQLLEDVVTVRKIIFLDVFDDVILIERIQKRAIIENRIDDVNLHTLKKRLEVYRDDTQKILNAYDQKLISKVNASQEKLLVFRDSLHIVIDTLL